MTRLAVLDLGKTNSKFLVFAPDGRILHQARRRPDWQRLPDGRVVLDEAGMTGWMRACLAEVAGPLEVSGVIVSGHGCTVALVDERDLVTPILDYEQDLPEGMEGRIDPLLPPYAETFTPALPGGQCPARFLLWEELRDPAAFARARHILTFPQFWGWRLGGAAVSEYSYLGCHSHFWAHRAGGWSSLVTARGWDARMPPLAPAGAITGTVTEGAEGVPGGIAIHNGVHDSNAALALHRAGTAGGFTLVSTGTWVVIMDGDCPLEALDPAQDMLANLDIHGRSVATQRFMGGREWEIASGGWRGTISAEAYAQAMALGAMALPAFAPAGPFPGLSGRLVPEGLAGELRAAVATLYVALMTDLGLDLIRSAGRIILDGGLLRVDGYAALLAALRPDQDVLASPEAEGSARGAAQIGFAARGVALPVDPPALVAPLALPGLAAYRARWREAVAAHASPA